MNHVPDPRSVLDAAQEAANAGDLESAERLLREALSMQEAGLGAVHPDLANTLNNLAVVCERLGKPAEAERGYRRAHAIAVKSLAPGHPFVATSLKNLVDFCAARGIPLWTPPAAPGDPAAVSPARPGVPPAPGSRARPAPAMRAMTPRVAAIVALSAVSLVVLLFVAPWHGAGDSARSSRAAPAPEPPGGVKRLPPTTETPAPASSREPAAAPSPVETNRPVPERVARVPPDPRSGKTISSAPVTVVSAQVCSAFERRGSEWQCTPASGVSHPGTFTFFTRLLAGSDTTIEHRWYRGGRLHQAIRLSVRANQGSGYRTFSRTTVGSERAGDWKVELRASDGTVLQEEHFVVR